MERLKQPNQTDFKISRFGNRPGNFNKQQPLDIYKLKHIIVS